MKKVKRQIGESDLFIETDTPEAIDLAFSAIRSHREQLLAYIAQHEEFLHSFSPVEVGNNAPPIVHAMAHAAKIANVGPMAAVAGALADFAIEEMMKIMTCRILLSLGIATIFFMGGWFVAFTGTLGIYAGANVVQKKVTNGQKK